MRRCVPILGLSLVALACPSAQGQVAIVENFIAHYESADASFLGQNSQPDGLASAAEEVDYEGGVAYGYANGSTGILRGHAAAPSGVDGYSQVGAHIQDVVQFNGGNGQTAAIAYHWDGSIAPYGGQVYASDAELMMEVDYADGTTAIQIRELTDAGCYTRPINNPVCTNGTSIDETGSFSFTIKPGETGMSLGLLLIATSGQPVNFNSTAAFGLELPAGVTYTSSTGEFLTGVTPVPEPSSTALLLAGLGAVGVVAWRRRG